MKIVVVAATSAIAEHCCRLWAAREPVDLTLIARDTGKAEKIAADLRVRSPRSTIAALPGDFHDPAAIQRLAGSIAATGPIDVVLIAQGWLSDQQACQDDLALCRQSLELNALSPVLFAEAFVRTMERQGHGTIGILGSVAGEIRRASCRERV